MMPRANGTDPGANRTPVVPVMTVGEWTYWYTPDGDGWPTRDEAIAAFRDNHDGSDPGWVQRVDERGYEPERVA